MEKEIDGFRAIIHSNTTDIVTSSIFPYGNTIPEGMHVCLFDFFEFAGFPVLSYIIPSEVFSIHGNINSRR